MKSIEYYKDAVMHRAEEKRTARKRAMRRTLAACLPLCLCLGIIGTVIVPRALHISQDSASGSVGNNSTKMPDAAVRYGDTVITIDDAETVYSAILSLYETSPTVAGGTPENLTFGGSDDGADGSADAESALEDNYSNGGSAQCYLYFRRPDGPHVFLLQNDVLTDLANGKNISVTAEQAQALMRGETP